MVVVPAFAVSVNVDKPLSLNQVAVMLAAESLFDPGARRLQESDAAIQRKLVPILLKKSKIE
jgi:hypothetical protein